ncbi:unnamed protein product, partial [Staurois parvus]
MSRAAECADRRRSRELQDRVKRREAREGRQLTGKGESDAQAGAGSKQGKYH